MMLTPCIEIELTHRNAILPEYMSTGAAAADVAAAIDASVTLEPGDQYNFPTGIKVKIEEGYEIQVRPRSGLAFKHGLTIINSPGTIDSDYRGEIVIILLNTSRKAYTVEPGERIAQLSVKPVIQGNFTAVAAILADTERGTGAFGSTGRGAPDANGSVKNDEIPPFKSNRSRVR